MKRAEGDGTVGWLTLVGGVYFVLYVLHFYLYHDPSGLVGLRAYLEVTLLGLPLIVQFGAILWAYQSVRTADVSRRLLSWNVGTALVMLVVGYLTYFVFAVELEEEHLVLMLHLFGAYGMSAGVIMGISEFRVDQRARALTHATLRRQQEARERKRLEYLNQFLRHEVLNDVNVINGYASLLSDELRDEPRLRDWAETIRDSGGEIAEFIQSIRTILDDADRAQIGRVGLDSLFDDTVEDVRTRFPEARISFQSPEPVQVWGDEMLGRAFRNLIENGIRHGGADAELTVDVEPGGDFVVVRISDDGPGIDDTTVETLFDPPKTGDHGYGLFLTRNLVELYGGRITLEETSDAGTTFAIRLERADSPRLGPPPNAIRAVD